MSENFAAERSYRIAGNVEQMPRCSICGGGLERYLDRMFDDRYGYLGYFRLDICPSCNLIETVPRLSEEDLPGLYGNYYPRRDIDIRGLKQQVGKPQTLRARWRRWLMGTDNQGQYFTKLGDTVLDYGCGAGVSLLEIAELGGKPYGVETDPNVEPIAEYYGLPIHVGQLSEIVFRNVKFDLIVLNQVIEHVPDPGQLINMLIARLNVNGKMVLSFPNTASFYRRLFGRAWINWHIPYHLHHYNRRSFEKFAASNTLRIESFRTVTPNLWTLLQFRVLLKTAMPGVPNPVWVSKSSSGATETKPGNSRTAGRFMMKVGKVLQRFVAKTARFIVSTLVLAANRIIDLTGFGDSIVVVIRPDRKK